jgi:hypothetical protein
MAALRTSLVKRRHAYTGVDIPWQIDVERPLLDTPGACRSKRRLFHYLSGGGLRAFGRPSGHALMAYRQTRFLWAAAVLGVLWLTFLFV